MLQIVSTRASVIQRQKDYKVYNSKRFINTADNINYWIGHIIEELAEFASAPQNQKASEAADVIIFLQNYLAVELPNYKLTIKLQSRDLYTPLPELIYKLRKLADRRKDWKTYPMAEIKDYSRTGALVIQYLLWFVPASDINDAYNSKVESNVTRSDWDRKSSISLLRV